MELLRKPGKLAQVSEINNRDWRIPGKAFRASVRRLGARNVIYHSSSQFHIIHLKKTLKSNAMARDILKS